MDTSPHALTPEEWREVITIEDVREGWGLTDHTAEEFASMVYGVKFNFHAGSPGYVGDLYMLQGESLEDGPMMLIRDKSYKLTVV